jgi:hypothetical protein
MTKNIDDSVEKLEQITSSDTVISIGGYNFTPAKLMIAGGILSTVLGGLYGAFEVYKDYMSMKEAITTYVAPDLSELNKKIEVLGTNVDKTVEYTSTIKNDLKDDIRRLEGVVENVERSTKTSQRETDLAVRDVLSELRQNNKEMDKALKDVRSETDKKIQKALDNPLAK